MRDRKKGPRLGASGGVLVATSVRPHMKRQEGETVEKWHDRIAHSCYCCGHYDEDLQALRVHEDSHSD